MGSHHENDGGTLPASLPQPLRHAFHVLVLKRRGWLAQLHPMLNGQVVNSFSQRLQKQPAAVKRSVLGSHSAAYRPTRLILSRVVSQGRRVLALANAPVR